MRYTEKKGFAYIGTDPLPKALVRVVSQFHIIQKILLLEPFTPVDFQRIGAYCHLDRQEPIHPMSRPIRAHGTRVERP